MTRRLEQLKVLADPVDTSMRQCFSPHCEAGAVKRRVLVVSVPTLTETFAFR